MMVWNWIVNVCKDIQISENEMRERQERERREEEERRIIALKEKERIEMEEREKDERERLKRKKQERLVATTSRTTRQPQCELLHYERFHLILSASRGTGRGSVRRVPRT